MRRLVFTKWLHFACRHPQSTEIQPLILDRNGAVALHREHSIDLLENGRWWPETYGRCITWAHQIALANPDPTGPGRGPKRADRVELTIFRRGRELLNKERAKAKRR